MIQGVTTILDASIEGGQIGQLLEARWSGEVDTRSIKSTMKMDVLLCKTPEMVHKEIWAHLLAFNLLRAVMAVTAAPSRGESCDGVLQRHRGRVIILGRTSSSVVMVHMVVQEVACEFPVTPSRIAPRPGRFSPPPTSGRSCAASKHRGLVLTPGRERTRPSAVTHSVGAGRRTELT